MVEMDSIVVALVVVDIVAVVVGTNMVEPAEGSDMVAKNVEE